MSTPSRQELQDELDQLRALIDQTRAMGLEVLELEDRAAALEAQLAAAQSAPDVPDTPHKLQLLTPDIAEGDWEGCPVVLIGGMAPTLPEHRAEAMEACVSRSMLPVAVGRLPANDDEATQAVHTVVDNVHVYIGLFAYRYGRRVGRRGAAIAEVEYDRAVKRGIPRLVFFMGRQHPIDPKDIERGEGSARLAMFKQRLRAENEVHTFVSAGDLGVQVRAKLAPR